MTNETTNTNAPALKLSTEIRKTWGKLTDEEIGFYEGKRDKFFDAVNAKYSIVKDEAEKTVKKLEAECAAACSATAEAPKPANDSTPAQPVAKAV